MDLSNINIKIMFNKLFSTPILYIKLRENLLTVKNVKNGEIYEDEPVVAIDDKKKILAVGKQAHTLKTKNNVVIVNGFSHPRTIINDFLMAEKALQYAVSQMYKNRFFPLSPIAVIQPMEKIEGGLTLIERRALREMAQGAGAREVFIWVGRELTDDEIISRNYPLSAGTLFEH
ncbi:rod shape-determining protein MreB [Beggiatoa sp. PS]|nr:rod shape-determining protein MreB [Beggiatoa sp. PS]